MRNTQQVRNILREATHLKYDIVYTNKHTNCRTIKAYVSNDDGADAVKTVTGLLARDGVEGTVKFLPSSLQYGGRSQTGSLIVRVPRTY